MNFYQAFHQTRFILPLGYNNLVFHFVLLFPQNKEHCTFFSFSDHVGYLISDSIKTYRKCVQLKAIEHLDLINVM